MLNILILARGSKKGQRRDSGSRFRMQEVSFGLVDMGREEPETIPEVYGGARVNEFGRSVRRRLSADVVCPWVINEEDESDFVEGIYIGGGDRTPLLPVLPVHRGSVVSMSAMHSTQQSQSGSTKSPNSPEGAWFLTTPAALSPPRLASPPCTPALQRTHYPPINRLGSDESQKGPTPYSSETSGNESKETDKSTTKQELNELENKIEALVEQTRRIEHRFSSLVDECLLELSRVENVPVHILRQMHGGSKKEKKQAGQVIKQMQPITPESHIKNELNRDETEKGEDAQSKISSSSSNAELFV